MTEQVTPVQPPGLVRLRIMRSFIRSSIQGSIVIFFARSVLPHCAMSSLNGTPLVLHGKLKRGGETADGDVSSGVENLQQWGECGWS